MIFIDMWLVIYKKYNYTNVLAHSYEYQVNFMGVTVALPDLHNDYN